MIATVRFAAPILGRTCNKNNASACGFRKPSTRAAGSGRGTVDLLARKAGGRGIAAHDCLALLVGQHLVDIAEAVRARASTASMTPSGPPVRFMRTICAVAGRRSCS